MFTSFRTFVLLLVVSTASQVSVTAPLPAVAVRLAGIVGWPVGSGSAASVNVTFILPTFESGTKGYGATLR